MKYTLINRNKSTNAGDHQQFVKWMRRNDIQYFETNEEFMEAYAHRKKTFGGIVLRYGCEDDFVEDLEKNQMLKIDKETKKWPFFNI